jgi:uridine monophosphate synthetase
MPIPFFERLEERAKGANSLLCVGLDPHPELLAEKSAEAALSFCLRIIEQTMDLACAYKPNSAFFEALGPEGMRVLGEVIQSIPEEIPVVLDAKRGDIASTAKAYAEAVFNVFKADAVTVSPYLGWDSLEPMLENPAHGVFMLCKTSNPSADEFQAKIVEGGVPFYVSIAQQAMGWERPGSVGLIVGATDPVALELVRSAAPNLWILAPGVGAQGGDLETALRAGLRSDGSGLLIPVSRGIAKASDPRREALQLRDRINEVRLRIADKPTYELPVQLMAIADALLDAGCVKFGSFIMKSGVESPIYIDLRLLASHPKLLAMVAEAYLPIIKDLEFDCLAAIPYAALPIATAISLQLSKPMIYHRREVKEYGTKAPIEGAFKEGETALVIDDLITTGGSKLEAIEGLTSAGLQVTDVAVLIDRQSKKSESLEAVGYHLHKVLTLDQLLNYWESAGRVSTERIEQVKEFLSQGG